MNKASRMIEENNKLREKLSLENQDYYENLLVYMRTVGLFYDDKELEQLVLQILQDIIAAQNEGETAESYFGKNPQETADELLKNIGTSKKEFFKIFGIVFGIASFFSIFSQLSDNKINFLVLVLNGFMSLLGVSISFKWLHKEIYQKKKPSKVRSFLKVWLFFILSIGPFILVSIFTPPVLTIPLSNPIVIGFIAAILFIITGWAFFSLDRKNKSPGLLFQFFGYWELSELLQNWIRDKNF